MKFLSQFKDYNVVKVTIADRYVVSNINLHGLPDEYCEAHLKSVTIRSPSVGANNSDNLGSTGEVNVIDYRDAVYKTLSGHFSEALNLSGKGPDGMANASFNRKAEDITNPSGIYPTIKIELDCYTGHKVWKGHIINWKLSFTGTTPSLVLEWISITPEQPPKEQPTPTCTFSTPSGFIKWIEDICKSKEVKLRFVDNNKSIEPDKFIKFISPFVYNPEEVPKGSNFIIRNYMYLVNKCTTLDDRPLTGTFNDEEKVFIISAKNNVSAPPEDKDTNSELIFIQNGAYPQFSTLKDKNKIVIPVSNFSFNMELTNLALAQGIIINPNGNSTVGNNDTNNSTGNADSIKASAKSDTMDDQSQAIKVSFTCYNVASFECYNKDKPIEVLVYNEMGEFHNVSGSFVVSECTYTIEHAVIQADVTCTKEYNSFIGTIDETSSTEVKSSDNPE